MEKMCIKNIDVQHSFEKIKLQLHLCFFLKFFFLVYSFLSVLAVIEFGHHGHVEMAWHEDTTLHYVGVCASIPGSEWSDTEATVVCKERGFTSGRALKPGTYDKKELASSLFVHVKASSFWILLTLL